MTDQMTLDWNRPAGVFVRDFMELIDDAEPAESDDAAMCWHALDGGDYCMCSREYHWVWALPAPPKDFTLGPEYPTQG